MDTPEPPTPEPQAAGKFQAFWLKWRLFIAGFLGWFLFEGVFWLLLYGIAPRRGSIDMAQLASINCLSVFLTMGVLVGFSFNKRTRLFSLGILAALALNIVIAQIILGTIQGAICFTPFFIDAPIY